VASLEDEQTKGLMWSVWREYFDASAHRRLFSISLIMSYVVVLRASLHRAIAVQELAPWDRAMSAYNIHGRTCSVSLTHDS